jgi:protein-tyrosine phosphatase
MGSPQFHLLFVCTANACRSPIAAEFARLRIRAAGSPAQHVLVSSAGTRGLSGTAMDPSAVAALRRLGVSVDGFSSRPLTVPLMAAADLVLTAERRHRAAAVALHPRSHVKTFTILEFARLVRHAEPSRLATEGVVPRALSLVREAARLRGVCPPPSADEDITDPHRRPIEDFHACAAAIKTALDGPLRLMLDEQIIIRGPGDRVRLASGNR